MEARSLSGAPIPMKGFGARRRTEHAPSCCRPLPNGLLKSVRLTLAGVIPMFARVCELHIRPEKKMELLRMMRNDILPLFQQYQGFFDLIPLELDTHPRKFFAISLWHHEEDARTYARDSFPMIYDMLEPFLAAPITVKHGTIDETIPSKFLAALAA